MKITLKDIFQVHKENVSCDIELRSGISVLTGPNGIGKSTFFHYLKNHRSSCLPGLTCAFMDQFPLLPLSELRGEDLISILDKDISWFNGEVSQKLVKKFNFENLLKNKVESYSGGENQILKFILLLSQEVDCYFLDEPLQYLDDKNIASFIKSLQDLADKKILIIEHRKEKISHINPHLYEMNKSEGGITIK